MERRRRFVPSADGLEARELLATVNPFNPISPINNLQNLPNTPAQKASRIHNLPFFMGQIQHGRFLPRAAIAQLQADLPLIEGKLHAPTEVAVNAFELTLRQVIPHQTVSVPAAHALNQAFGEVLDSAGATSQAQQALRADMNAIVRSDTNGINPVILATDDYSIVIQTALGIGRPIRTPSKPQLAPGDVLGPKGSHVTNHLQPHLVGTYEPNATMQIIDESGTILGSAHVAKNGDYSVQFAQPLAAGLHTVSIQGVDSGEVSPPSALYRFRVVVRPTVASHPQGPLALH